MVTLFHVEHIASEKDFPINPKTAIKHRGHWETY